MRTKTESFTARLGLSRAAPAFRGQLCSDLQPFQRLPSHCGAERFKGFGHSFTAVKCDEHGIPSLLPGASELNGTFLCTCTQLLSNSSIPGGDGTLHNGAHSVSQVGGSSTLGGNSVGLDMCAPFRLDDSRGNMILTRSRHTILPKSTTLASRGASRFRALRCGTVGIPVDSHRPHICDWSQRGTDGMYLTLKEKEVVLHQFAERAELCSV